MELFFRDFLQNKYITWNQLIIDLNNSDCYNPYCQSKNYYEVFKQIILSIIHNHEIILLDSDFSIDERSRLIGNVDFNSFIRPLDKRNHPLNSKNELLTAINNPSKNWSVTLFTSGTTGLPKKVSHKFESITRSVKISNTSKTNIWGFAYNPTHMAGLQVFFQALLNGNTIIRLFNLSKDEIYSEISKNGITNISATPTFYRLLIPNKDIYPSITRLTSGGEKFDTRTISQLTAIFPNAKITNVYASTEAGSLFASEGNTFTIKANIQHLVKIENDELIIHNSLLGNSDLISETWYPTGDMVDIISENPTVFQFVSRNNEMINVGGYKVNPYEVEEVIRNIAGIYDARVYSKKNSVLGNIVCCEVVRTNKMLEESFIRTFLQTKIQEYKIPRMIRFVDQIQTTLTGKIKRN